MHMKIAARHGDRIGVDGRFQGAIEFLAVGQVCGNQINLVDKDINRWGGLIVTEVDLAVFYAKTSNAQWKEFLHAILPTFVDRRLLLRRRPAGHEVYLWLVQFYFPGQVSVKQRSPSYGKVHGLYTDKRDGGFSACFKKLHPFNRISAAPKLNIDSINVAIVTRDLSENSIGLI